MNTDECATEPQSHREKLKRIRSDFKSVYGKDWLTTGARGTRGLRKGTIIPHFLCPVFPVPPWLIPDTQSKSALGEISFLPVFSVSAAPAVAADKKIRPEN